MGEVTPQPTVDCSRLGFSNFFQNHAGPFAYNGAIYTVVVNSGCLSNTWDGAAGGTPATKVYAQVMKSTDNGVTWSGPLDSGNARELPPRNASNTVPTDGYQTAQCVQDGQTLYVLRPVWDYVNYLTAAAHRLVISQFDMGSETWGADVTAYGDANAPTLQTVRGLSTIAQTFQFARRASDGAFIAVYTQNVVIPGSWRAVNINPAFGYDHVYYSVYSGGAWAAPVLVAGGAADATDYYPNTIAWGDSERLHIVMAQKTGNAGTDNSPYTGRVFHRSLSALGVLGTLQTAATIAPNLTFSSIDNYWVGRADALTISGSTEILVPCLFQAATSFFSRELHALRFTSAVDPTFTDETVSTDFNNMSGSGTGAFIAVADPAAQQFFIVTTDRAQENVLQYVNSAPGVWDAPTVMVAAPNLLLGCLGGAVYVDSGSGDYYFGLVFTDGPAGAYWADDTFTFAADLGEGPGPGPDPDPGAAVAGLALAGGTGGVGVLGVCGVNAQPGGPWWQDARVLAAGERELQAQAARLLVEKGCGVVPGVVYGDNGVSRIGRRRNGQPGRVGRVGPVGRITR